MRGRGLEPLWRSAKYLIYLTEQSERPPGTGCDCRWLLPPVTTFEGQEATQREGAHPISPADMSQAGREKPIGGMNGVSRRLTEHPKADRRHERGIAKVDGTPEVGRSTTFPLFSR